MECLNTAWDKLYILTSRPGIEERQVLKDNVFSVAFHRLRQAWGFGNHRTSAVKNMGTTTVNKFENELRRMIPYKRNTAYAKYFKIEK